jgi:nitric oxide reductase activation protein
MGAAMRHAGHYLEHQTADKKLMLILTDGEPADVDMANPEMLIEDARMAKIELQDKAIYSYCINLDPKADDYVERIFGNHYTIVDNIERLPEKMAEVFISLTG